MPVAVMAVLHIPSVVAMPVCISVRVAEVRDGITAAGVSMRMPVPTVRVPVTWPRCQRRSLSLALGC